MISTVRVLKVLSLSLIFAAVHATSLDEVEINAQAVEDLNYRLNDDVLPSHYKIEIKPYFENVSNVRSKLIVTIVKCEASNCRYRMFF